MKKIFKQTKQHWANNSDIPTWVWLLFAAIVLALLLQPQEAHAWELFPTLAYSEGAPVDPAEGFNILQWLIGLGALISAFIAGKSYGYHCGNKDGRGEIEIVIGLSRKLVEVAQCNHDALCSLEDIIPDAKGNVCPVPPSLVTKGALSVWPWQVTGDAADWSATERARFKDGYSAGLKVAATSMRKSSMGYIFIADGQGGEWRL